MVTAIRRSVYDQRVAILVDCFYFGLELDIDAEFACPLHQLFDKIGLEPFEGVHASVQQCHFGSAANSDMGKFKGNVSPADENHSPRQRIEF